LRLHDVAAPADEEPDLEIEFGGRRSDRVRTWSAMVWASRGSDLFSPPTAPAEPD